MTMNGYLGTHCTTRRRSPRSVTPFLRVFTTWLACLALMAAGLQASATTYSSTYQYDPNGRLRSVESQGQSAEYDYDQRGNIIRVKATTGTSPVVTSFAPDYGPPGVNILLTGANFTPTSSVYFGGALGGTLAVSTDGTQITAQVPQNAVSGPITVTTSAGTATSNDTFTVTSFGVAPTITSFSPSLVQSGGTVTIVGQHLDPIAGETSVALDGIDVTPPQAAITDSAITVTVPVYAWSGQFTISTPYGSATSTSSLTVVPYFVNPTQATTLPPITVGSAGDSISLSTNSEAAAIATFQGQQGVFYTIQTSGFSNSTASASIEVYSPTGSQVGTDTGIIWVSKDAPTVHLPPLPSTGVYTIVITNADAKLGFSLALQQDSILNVDGAATSVPQTGAGQSVRLTFPAQAGDKLGFGLTALNFAIGTSTSKSAYVEIDDPLGNSMWMGNLGYSPSCVSAAANCGYAIPAAPSTGTYQFVVTPVDNTAKMSFGLIASHDVVNAALTTNGTAQPMTIARQGQNGWYSFTTNSQYQQAVLDLSTMSTTPINGTLNVSVLNPNGTDLQIPKAVTAKLGATSSFNLSLEAAGTYWIYINPSAAATAKLYASVLSATPNALTIGSINVPFEKTQPGQNVVFTFSATQGENLGFGITSLSLSPTSSSMTVAVVGPGGNNWVSESCTPANSKQCDLDLVSAPATGTYTVTISPSTATTTMSFSASLTDDTVQAIAPGATNPTPLSIASPGQNGWYTFTSSTPYQNATLSLSSIATKPLSQPLNIKLYNPDGTTTWGSNTSGTSSSFSLPLLQSGAYRIYVDPTNAATATLKGALTFGTVSTPTPPSGVAPGNLQTTTGGQSLTVLFNEQQDANLNFALTQLKLANDPNGANGYVSYELYSPQGTALGGTFCGPSALYGCSIHQPQLPTTGTYWVIITPDSSTTTMTLTATASTDLPEQLTVGTPAPVPTTVPGQAVSLAFSNSTPGQQIYLGLSSIVDSVSTGSITFTLLNPDGTSLTWASWNTNSPNIVSFNQQLQQTGTYHLSIVPDSSATISLSATLANNPPTVLTLGTQAPFTTSLPAQSQLLTFSAQAGQNVSLDFTGISEPGSSSPTIGIFVTQPDGTQISSNAGNATLYCYPTSYCNFSMQNLLLSGTYTVTVAPFSGTATMGFTILATTY